MFEEVVQNFGKSDSDSDAYVVPCPTQTKIFDGKVQLFWEGHKNVHNCPNGFEIYLVTVKTIRTIAHIFVAFSEKLNFI